jgi:hypothetical protein
MAEPVTNPDSQQLAAGDVGNAAQGSSPIFAEEAGQIEPRHTGGRSVVPRAPGSSPVGAQQADSAPRIGGGGGASPVIDARQQQQGQASGSGSVDTCGPNIPLQECSLISGILPCRQL